MKLFLKVKPSAKQEKIEQAGVDTFIVWVKEPAKENKANFAVLRVVADHFGVPISRVRLLSGATSKEKVAEIV